MSEPPALIADLIVDRPMCLPCLDARTRTRLEALKVALEVLGRSVMIRRDPATTCTACRASATVYVLMVE